MKRTHIISTIGGLFRNPKNLIKIYLAGFLLGCSYAFSPLLFTGAIPGAPNISSTPQIAALGSPKGSTPQIISTSPIHTLYFQCANKVNVLSAKGAESPGIETGQQDGLQIMQDPQNPGGIKLMPKSRVVHLSELKAQNGQSLKVNPVHFNVVKPPKPKIEIWNGEQLVDLSKPQSKTAVFRLRLAPDPLFADKMPEEAHYSIKQIRIMSAHSCIPQSIGLISGKDIDASLGIEFSLEKHLKNHFPGSKIYIKIESIFRKNSLGQLITEKFGERELYIPLRIK